MLLQVDGVSPPGRTPAGGHHGGLLDSPTLARVERAMLRHEEGAQRENALMQRAAFTQSLLPHHFGKESGYHAIKRGLLWQQRDKLFSRWKERYFILTRDYLHCFRRASGTDRISEMGQFLFKIKLVEVERIEWENKKTYSTVALILGRDGKILLRAPDGLEDWFELLEECMLTSKERRRALRFSHDVGKPRNNNNSINSTLEEWLAARQKIPAGRLPTDSVSTTRQDSVTRRVWTHRDENWDSLDNRLSLLTDIDINSYDEDTLGAPSVASYRISEDVLCVQPPSLRGSGSFRSPRSNSAAVKRTCAQQEMIQQPQLIKFRERSHSDIQKLDRRPWRPMMDSHRITNFK